MTTKSGQDRYPHRARLRADRDLGRPMLPAEIFVALKRIADLDDDDLLDAFERGAETLSLLPPEAGERERMGLRPEEVQEAIAAASDVTRSRLTAWRKHQRQMTWIELRALLRGLSSPDACFDPRGAAAAEGE